MTNTKAKAVKTAITAIVRHALFICPLFAAAAFSQLNSTVKIERDPPGPGTVIGIIVFFASVIGLLVFFYTGTRRKGEQIEQELSSKLFGEGCERARLTREEMNVLLGIVAFAPDPPTKGHLIFDSLQLYERCLEAYVEHTLRVQTSSGRIDEQDDILLRLRKKMGYAILAPEQPVVSTRNLSVGQRVSIFLPEQRNDSFDATVTHIGEFWFTVRLLDDFMGIVSMGGMEKTLAFLRQGDAAYSVTVKVKEFLEPGEINFFHSGKLSRNQHRQYMRLDISLGLKYRVLNRVGAIEKPTDEILDAHTADISGGGVCLVARQPLTVGDEIQLSIHIPGNSISGVKARVLKVIAANSRGGTLYRHLVQFIQIEPQQRERIVKYIFDKHREILQMR
jgi:c-di-GMP-binding flagellar brake protein YcgR